MDTLLTPGRTIRVFTVGIAAVISLYAIVAFLAEPLRTLAANTAVVNLTVAAGITNNCTGPVSLGTITGDGDTGTYSGARATTCTVRTNDSAGYTLAWRILTGSGHNGVGQSGTGFLNDGAGNKITSYFPAVANTPETWNFTDQTKALWGGRLSSTSTTVSTATWGTDASTEKWLNVGTGSYTIATRTSATTNGGDSEVIGFRAQIGTSKIQPTGTYTATVTFTATAS